jgi:hypothetical protein
MVICRLNVVQTKFRVAHCSCFTLHQVEIFTDCFEWPNLPKQAWQLRGGYLLFLAVPLDVDYD